MTHPNLDLVNIDVHTRFGKILSILSGNENITEGQKDGRTGQIQYSPALKKGDLFSCVDMRI